MSSESPPAKKPRVRALALTRGVGGGPPPLTAGLRWFDAVLVLGFLALTFLLGVFPLKDTDFWWHLRTGDLIRQTGVVPTVDLYTFGAEGRPWIDLHWVFQVAVSLIYERGGVPALTVAKCLATCLAVLLLVTAGRREWPVWATLIAWLPALLVLGGRMYVRPETLTLLYLSVFLAVLVRVDRAPALALWLPIVQVAWVNTQGLFVFGPILLGAAVVDAAVRPGAFAPAKKRWWRIVGLAALLDALACLVNPYGIHGALYPVQLARTMGNPVFSKSIAELMPIPDFIRRGGLTNPSLWLHLLTMFVGALSFLVPIAWLALTRLRSSPAEEAARAETAKPRREKPSKKRPKANDPARTAPAWRLSPFRLLLYTAFSVLSWQATRNSHQFAAVVGAVTAWNFGEWAGAVRRRAWGSRGASPPVPGEGLAPRLVALAAIAGVFVLVATGRFYAITGEGRTIGLGEQPLWYPHEAVKFSGTAGMPERFLGFHNGHASLYEYQFGPARKVYVDARLEVMGADLYERYLALEGRIQRNEPGWARQLDDLGRPLVLIDLESNAAVGATLLTSPDWRCVWFDPIAAVFVHGSYDEVVRAHAVDFGDRHFRPAPALQPGGPAAFLASAKGLRNLANFVAVTNGPERARALVLLGLDHARRFGQADPDSPDSWKLLGQFETLREPLPPEPVPRFRMPFDPVFDLSVARATYALRRAVAAAPDDFLAVVLLQMLYERRAMTEAESPLLDTLTGLSPVNVEQKRLQARSAARRSGLRRQSGPPSPPAWENLSQLARAVNGLLADGRAGTAAETLERATPPGSRSWEDTDRIATLRLHLGEPARARAIWQGAPAPPRPAVREARVAVTFLVEGAFDAARESFRAATAADPTLFEARYGLAVLEQDVGRASEALAAARKAVSHAPGAVSRDAAQGVVAFVTPYAPSAIARAAVPSKAR